jgi:polygalacturonase
MSDRYSRRLFSGIVGAAALAGPAFADAARPGDRPDDVVNAKAFGAAGDGTNDDTAALQNALNAAFGSAQSPIPQTSNRILFIPSGNYRITSPLRIRSMFGGVMLGAGRFATRIFNAAGGSVFVTNGCQYCRFENMRLSSNQNGVIFDLDWDGTGTALQSNTFHNMYFDAGSVGLRIGFSGKMGSENLILNCFFERLTLAGLQTLNFNALQQTVVGGNFQTCGIGILVSAGSVPTVQGVGFQQSARWDIQVLNGANDAMSISGCRSESTDFASINHQAASICSCSHMSATRTPGTFAQCYQPSSIAACVSVTGQVDFPAGGTVDASQFGRDDWIVSYPNHPVFTRTLRTGKTFVRSGTGTPKNYAMGSWLNATYTGA